MNIIRETLLPAVPIACLTALLYLTNGFAFGSEFLVSSPSEVEAIAKRVKPGDTVVLKNGKWHDRKLKFERIEGTLQSPILIRAEQPGQVVFSGATEFRLSGRHVTVSGLVFRDIETVSDVFELRTHSERLAHECRITDCVFEQAADSKSSQESRWLSVYGTQNRVDHCAFSGKQNRGTTLVVWVTETPGKHRIDHNYFGPRPELGRNGGETIRIGTSEVSELNCGTIVEDNYFYRCNGEAEIISNKSCENIYRHNWFEECSGALTLRHGHRCQVDGNVFAGKKASGTGGVRIIGSGHVVTNNYFEGLRGDAERAAISMMNGVPESPLNEYAPVTDAVVAYNSFFDCKVSLEFGVGAGAKQSIAPEQCQIVHNLFAPGKWQLMRVHALPQSSVWSGNLVAAGGREFEAFEGFECKDVKVERSEQGLMRPADAEQVRSSSQSNAAAVDQLVPHDIDGQPRDLPALAGCAVPGNPSSDFPSPQSTGPSWDSEISK